MDGSAKIIPAGGDRVALVHHHTLLREGLCRILDSGGFSVVWQAAECEGIVNRLIDCVPGLILLEWEAPGVDAPLIEELVSSSLACPVVIMSRPDTSDDLAPALEAGAAGCLSVNLDPRDFVAALRMLVRGGILVSHEMVPAVTSLTGNAAQPHDSLTPRELEVLRALGRGATNLELAAELGISPHTVKIHVRRVLAKLGLRNRQQAAVYAVEHRV